MNSSVDLLSILITNLAGVTILFIILMTRGWNLPTKRGESKLIFIMLIASVVNCLLDAVASYYDGRPGLFLHAVLIVCNTYLYLYNLIIGIGVIHLIIMHIDQKATGFQIGLFGVISIVQIVFLGVNLFYPLVFEIGDDNVYSRGPFYILFVASGFVLIFYGYIYYFVSKLRNPFLRYFPVFGFLFPILLGVVLQAFMYGISLQPISFAVAFSGIVISLQNECIYVDKLTGVYNRYELDKILEVLARKHREKIGILMLDLNGFKSINDNYSHEEGDKALITFANILVGAVRSDGIVIRFAGDEFIVILRKIKDINIDDYKNRIFNAVDTFNRSSDRPYTLSAAIGAMVFDCGAEEVGTILTKIDHLMYADKNDYYRLNDRRRRRT